MYSLRKESFIFRFLWAVSAMPWPWSLACISNLPKRAQDDGNHNLWNYSGFSIFSLYLASLGPINNTPSFWFVKWFHCDIATIELHVLIINNYFPLCISISRKKNFLRSHYSVVFDIKLKICVWKWEIFSFVTHFFHFYKKNISCTVILNKVYNTLRSPWNEVKPLLNSYLKTAPFSYRYASRIYHILLHPVNSCAFMHDAI